MAENKENDSSRRNFLRLGLGLGAASVAGAMSAKLMATDDKPDTRIGEKVKVLTTDGKLIEIDAEQVGSGKEKGCLYFQRGSPERNSKQKICNGD